MSWPVADPPIPGLTSTPKVPARERPRDGNAARRKFCVYGAGRDLERTIRTHLFVICANNSGSTFLKEVLATCRATWNLPREGQKMLGYAGPGSRRRHRIDLGLDPWVARQSHGYGQL